MTKGERTELTSLINQRARVMKAAVIERSAELMANLEEQLAAIYSFDQEEIWKAAHEIAKKAAKEAQAEVAARCEELGIPKQFAPSVHTHWYAQGEQASKDRRREIRTAAKAKIDALEKSAKTEIEMLSLEAKTDLVANGLISDSAKTFLKEMPSFQTLMPTLQVSKTTGLLE